MNDEPFANLTEGAKVVVLHDDSRRYLTTVRTPPWQLGHGAWVAGLEGIAGGYDCNRVRLASPSDSQLPEFKDRKK